MRELENLSQKIANKEISCTEASLELMKFIFQKPKYFGLTNLDEEELMDFLMYNFQRSMTFLKKYDTATESFPSYVHSCIQRNYAAWVRIQKTKLAEEQSYSMLNPMNYENSLYNYTKNEKSYFFETNNEDLHTLEEISETSRKINEEYYNLAHISSKKLSPALQKIRKLYTLRREACVILAIKSCYHISDDLIEKVSLVSGYSFEELKKMIETASRSLKNKIRIHEQCLKRRDNAYYFHRRFQIQKETFDVNSAIADTISRKYKRQTESWKKANSLIINKRKVIPSNRTVAKILKISERHVEYVLRKAKENMDNISLSSYYDDYENLFSDR